MTYGIIEQGLINNLNFASVADAELVTGLVGNEQCVIVDKEMTYVYKDGDTRTPDGDYVLNANGGAGRRIKMVSSNSVIPYGATLPTTGTVGQQYILILTNRSVLYIHDGTGRKPYISTKDVVIYVDLVNGTDEQEKGDGPTTDAFKTINYAISQVPALTYGNVDIFISGGIYYEDVSIKGLRTIGGKIRIQGERDIRDSGTATGSGGYNSGRDYYLSDSSKSRATDTHKGRFVLIASGTYQGMIATVKSNTATDLILQGGPETYYREDQRMNDRNNKRTNTPDLTGATYEIFDLSTQIRNGIYTGNKEQYIYKQYIYDYIQTDVMKEDYGYQFYGACKLYNSDGTFGRYMKRTGIIDGMAMYISGGGYACIQAGQGTQTILYSTVIDTTKDVRIQTANFVPIGTLITGGTTYSEYNSVLICGRSYATATVINGTTNIASGSGLVRGTTISNQFSNKVIDTATYGREN